MAAPEASRARYCEKCFALIASGADFCAECGAKVETGGLSEGSDAEINPELARANLLRMRGDYKQAEDVCLAILRRFPNNMSANMLLGDIGAESGDLDQAVQWYELALDLQRDSAVARRKLESVRQRKADHEAATTAKQLGLPTTRPKGAIVAVALLTFIVCIGLAAYTVGRSLTPAPHGPLLDAPVTVPSSVKPRTTDTGQAPPSEPQPTPGSGVHPKDDRDLLDLLARKSPDGAMILDASQDPRSKDVVLTFAAPVGEDELKPAARLAAAALEAVPASSKVTLRAVRDGKLSLVADATRSALARTTSAEWQDAHKDDPDAWMSELLSDVWRPQ